MEIFKNIKPDLKGSQLVIKVKGKTVVDLAARVSPDSMTTVFSVSKALSAISLAKLVGEGKLNLDERMAHYWPEFAAHHKGELTVRQVLSHQAGLTATDPHLTDEMVHDDHAASAALAAQIREVSEKYGLPVDPERLRVIRATERIAADPMRRMNGTPIAWRG